MEKIFVGLSSYENILTQKFCNDEKEDAILDMRAVCDRVSVCCRCGHHI